MHSAFLKETLALAQIRRGYCAPNPSVGAVVVRDNCIISSGYHHAAGQPHAEVEALKGLTRSDLLGATLYVSLEPCCHFGKTPPCAQLLIERGVQNVIFAFRDPNPLVAGQGQSQLRQAGIRCELHGVAEIDAFYGSYQHWVLTGRPRVTAKLALSLDGKTGLRGGAPHPISGQAASELTHREREQADAILTTARTVLADNPSLNCRSTPERPVAKPVYIIDARAETPIGARLFQTAEKITIFVADSAQAGGRVEALAQQGARLVKVPADTLEPAHLDLTRVLNTIGQDGIHDLWVEAGGTMFNQLRADGHLSRAILYVSPKWLGNRGSQAFAQAEEDLFASASSLNWQGQGRDAVLEVSWNR